MDSGSLFGCRDVFVRDVRRRFVMSGKFGDDKAGETELTPTPDSDVPPGLPFPQPGRILIFGTVV